MILIYISYCHFPFIFQADQVIVLISDHADHDDDYDHADHADHHEDADSDSDSDYGDSNLFFLFSFPIYISG